MRIVYSKHALKKFKDFKIFGIVVTRTNIYDVLRTQKYISRDDGNLIAAADFDEKHNLRVVYKERNDDIIIITFYTYRKGRYGEY